MSACIYLVILLCTQLTESSKPQEKASLAPAKQAGSQTTVDNQPGSAEQPISADSIALRILDSEALYTTAGGLKPLSDGFWQGSFPANQSTSTDVERMRAILASYQLGHEVTTGIHVFKATHDNKKFASAYIAHRESFRRKILQHSAFFQAIGITCETSPSDVMNLIDQADSSSRWRGFGLIFGYPAYAVDFFVKAGEEEKQSGKFVKRDFLHLKTTGGSEGKFVYAVPKGHTLRIEDIELRNETDHIFCHYSAWRDVYLNKNKLRAKQLLETWCQYHQNVSSRILTND